MLVSPRHSHQQTSDEIASQQADRPQEVPSQRAAGREIVARAVDDHEPEQSFPDRRSEPPLQDGVVAGRQPAQLRRSQPTRPARASPP